jgi:hypothetical protein
MEDLGEKNVPPVAIAAVVVVVGVIGFFLYRAGQPPASTTPVPSSGLRSVDPRYPGRPPVDNEHANDWRPPARSATTGP